MKQNELWWKWHNGALSPEDPGLAKKREIQATIWQSSQRQPQDESGNYDAAGTKPKNQPLEIIKATSAIRAMTISERCVASSFWNGDEWSAASYLWK